MLLCLRMSLHAKNPYQEQLLIIQRHLMGRDAEMEKVLLTERIVIIILCCILLLSPSMFVRWLFGKIGRMARKVAVEFYVWAKTGVAIYCLYDGGWGHPWFMWFAAIMLSDLFAFISGLMLLRSYWRAPISLNRSLILLGFNFCEYTAWFAGMYLSSRTLLNGEVIVTDPTSSWYFSTVTAATVGYGDFHPGEKGHVLAMLQIGASIIFFAAIVAYFIGGLERHHPDAEPPNAIKRG